MIGDQFSKSGFVVLPGMLDAGELQVVDSALNGVTAGRSGARQMLALDWCTALAKNVRQQLVAAGLIPFDHVAVQCTFFEKSREHNWLVSLHQDMSIPVRCRVDNAELTGWSEKDGGLYVQPPVVVLEQLVALRLHIDECGADDGALKVVPGSHGKGRLREVDKTLIRDELGELLCPVAAGGGMAMRPLLLHASSKATGCSSRRVLHFLFGPTRLRFGLEWAAVR